MGVDVEGCASRDETSEQIRQERCSILDSTTDEGDQDGTRGPRGGATSAARGSAIRSMFVRLCFRDAAMVSEWQYRPMLPHGQGLHGRDRFSVCVRSNVM